MATNKLVAKSAEEILRDYKPVYVPLYASFVSGNSRRYEAEVASFNFRRATTIGDIRAKNYTPKDTEIKEIAVGEGNKGFKSYFFANRYIVSDFQSNEDADQVVAQVLDEHHLQADELLFFGDGTAPNNVKNNGLFYSQDSNYVLESSKNISAASAAMASFYAAVIASKRDADDVAGRKIIVFYGDASNLVDALFPTSERPVRSALTEALGADYTIMTMPKRLSPSGQSGWIVVNMDAITLHYSLFPQVLKSGTNDEMMYAWYNFVLGSMMVDVTQQGGIIRQPVVLL